MHQTRAPSPLPPSWRRPPLPLFPAPPATSNLTRRSLLLGAAGVATAFALAACTGGPNLLTATSGPVTAAEKARRRTGRTTRIDLAAGKTDIDLAGRTASTWAYNGQVPGPVTATPDHVLADLKKGMRLSSLVIPKR